MFKAFVVTDHKPPLPLTMLYSLGPTGLSPWHPFCRLSVSKGGRCETVSSRSLWQTSGGSFRRHAMPGIQAFC